MKITALVDVCVKGKNYAKGDVIDVNDGSVAVLLEHGWAEETKEEPKPKKKKKEVEPVDDP